MNAPGLCKTKHNFEGFSSESKPQPIAMMVIHHAIGEFNQGVEYVYGFFCSRRYRSTGCRSGSIEWRRRSGWPSPCTGHTVMADAFIPILWIIQYSRKLNDLYDRTGWKTVNICQKLRALLAIWTIRIPGCFPPGVDTKAYHCHGRNERNYMVWITFILTSTAIVFAAYQLANTVM